MQVVLCVCFRGYGCLCVRAKREVMVPSVLSGDRGNWGIRIAA